jgi:hypothetical protein
MLTRSYARLMKEYQEVATKQTRTLIRLTRVIVALTLLMLGRFVVQIWLAFQSSYSARQGVTDKIGQASHRQTYPERPASCVPTGSLATPMEFLRLTAPWIEPHCFFAWEEELSHLGVLGPWHFCPSKVRLCWTEASRLSH